MVIRRVVVPLAALALAVGSATAASASDPRSSDGIETGGEVPETPTTSKTTADIRADITVETTNPDDPRNGTGGGTSGNSAGGAGAGSNAGNVEKEVAVPPVLHCVWVTADMDGQTTAIERQHLGLADDLPDVPTPTPCGNDPASGAPMTVPTSDALAHLRPWSADDPGARVVEVWMIVSHAAGPEAITDVLVGFESTELDMAGLDVSSDAPGATEIGDALAAGVISGQIASTVAADLEELVLDGWGRAVRTTLRLSYLDGCGALTVTGTGWAGDETATVTAPVDVPCYHRLLADFDEVSWGALVRGAETVVSGDLDRGTPGQPTLFNAGNTPIVLATTFDPLCSVEDPQDCFGDFGVELSGSDGEVQRLEPASPGAVLLATEPVICPGQVVRLDVLVRTPDIAAGGDYAGSMDMVGHSAESQCAVHSVPPTGPTTSQVSSTAATTTTTAATGSASSTSTVSTTTVLNG
jgi:hypothetical protein